MKTPFDGAIRLGQREIDDMRVAINVQIAQVVKIEAARADNEREARRQREVAGDDAMLSSYAYLARMRAERARLNESQATAEGQLSRLRSEALAAYGTLKAVGSAADAWRGDAERAIEQTEQGHLDDLTNAGFVRGRRKGRA